MKKYKIIFSIITFIIILFIYNTSISKATEINNNQEDVVTVEKTIELDENVLMDNSRLYSRLTVSPKSLSQEDIEEYYYNQLTSDISRQIYNAMLKDTTGEGTVTIKLEGCRYKVSDTSEDKLWECFDANLAPYLYDGMCAFRLDNSDRYWWREAKVNYKGKVDADESMLEITEFSVISVFEERADINNFNSKIQEVANSITGNSEYDIVRSIHDYICENVIFAENVDENIVHTAYGALMNGEAVCEGMAQLFKILCDKKGLKTIYIYGGSEANTITHAWIYLYHTYEQKWYAIDVTWDNDSSGTSNNHTYFMVGGNSKNDNNQTFLETHIPYVRQYVIQNTTFQVPVLSTEAYEKFSGKVEYSTKINTNNNVIVKIKANRAMNEIDGWELSSDGLTMQKEYTENTNEDIVVSNSRGEEFEVSVNVDNIDKTGPNITVDYSTTEKTNKPVTVTLNSDEKLQEVDGWTISSDAKSMQKEYSGNTTETIQVYDLLGNATTVNINVNNINTVGPKCTVEYTTLDPTNEDVGVMIYSDLDLKPVEGWEISEDQKTLSKIYSENTSEIVQVEDLYGNTNIVNVNINNIDKDNPEVEVNYSEEELTNKDIEVTIKANERIKQLTGWEISEDETEISRTYSENTEEEIEIEDLAGNTVVAQINISNIDKQAPELSITYSTEEMTDKVQVEITADEEIKQLEGWEISEDRMTITKVYTNNTVETVEIEDLAGNKTEQVIEIKNIEENGEEASTSNTSNTTQNGDETVYNGVLPYAGESKLIICLIAGILIAGIIYYKKYKKYDK